MSILDTAIKVEGSVGKLALSLGVRQNVVSNWRARGVPKPWEKLLQIKYAEKRKRLPTPTATEGA